MAWQMELKQPHTVVAASGCHFSESGQVSGLTTWLLALLTQKALCWHRLFRI
jgi:hypothetical protein